MASLRKIFLLGASAVVAAKVLTRISVKALDNLYDRRLERAAADPEWAEIDGRRVSPDGRYVLLSEDLGMAEFERQNEIASRITPDPPWVPAARFFAQDPISQLLAASQRGFERASRGWAVEDIWSYDNYLTASMSGALAHMADNATGWPSDNFETFEAWQEALRENANLLARFAHKELSEPIIAELDFTGSVEDREAVYARIADAESRELEGAQQALRWVAEHLTTLWD